MKHKIEWRSQAQGRAMIQAIFGRPLILEDKVRSQTNRRGICRGQSVTLRAFPPSTSVFPCQCHSTNAPYSFIHQPLILQQMTLVNQKPVPLHPAINEIITVINVLSNDGPGVRNRHKKARSFVTNTTPENLCRTKTARSTLTDLQTTFIRNRSTC